MPTFAPSKMTQELVPSSSLVRTPGFHPGNSGSNPGGTTKANPNSLKIRVRVFLLHYFCTTDRKNGQGFTPTIPCREGRCGTAGAVHDVRENAADYLLPFSLLWCMQSIWPFSILVAPPLLHAVTWSASISFMAQIFALLALPSNTQSGQLPTPASFASWFGGYC